MATSINSPSLEHAIRTDIPAINVIVNALAKGDPSVLSDLETGTKRVVEGPSGWEFQQLGKDGWMTLSSFNIDAQTVDGFEASAKVVKNTIPVRDAEGKIPGDISGTAASAESLTSILDIGGGGTGASSVEQARSNLGVPPTKHSLNSPDYGAGTNTLYGHLKLSDSINLTSGENEGIAATPKAVKAAYDRASEGLTASDAVQENLDNFTTTQAAKDAEQDAAIAKKVSKVNDCEPDANGNVDVGGMPLGTAFPYTGTDVPAGTLRADGTTYTNMQASFPEFYEWVVASGLTVPLADYALVEGSCGYYGLDTSTGTVRMPTLAAGVFGTVAAGKYGQAVEAGAPNITGAYSSGYGSDRGRKGAFSGTWITAEASGNGGDYPNGGNDKGWHVNFDASLCSSAYRNDIDTVQPSHVKYPWVIVVYNAAVPPSVAQAGEFVELLDGKENKGAVRDVNGVNADAMGKVAVTKDPSGTTFCTFTNMYGNALKVSFIAGNGGSVTLPAGGMWAFFFWYYGSSDLVAGVEDLPGGAVWKNTSARTIVSLAIRTA